MQKEIAANTHRLQDDMQEAQGHNMPTSPSSVNLHWHKEFLEQKKSLQQILPHTKDVFNIPMPSYVLCADSLRANTTLLRNVANSAQARILVALKGYSFWRAFESVRTNLDGATCSGVHESILAFESIALPCFPAMSVAHYSKEDLDAQSQKAIPQKIDTSTTHKTQYNESKQPHAQQSSIELLTHILTALLPHCTSENPSIAKLSQLTQDSHPNALAIYLQKQFESLETTRNDCGINQFYRELCKEIPYALFAPLVQKEICVFAPAYKENQIRQILPLSTHIIFNSLAQWERYKPLIDSVNARLERLYRALVEYERTHQIHIAPQDMPKIEIGLRINPLYSEVEPPIYNPCIPKSRLGIIPSVFHAEMSMLATKYGFDTPSEFFTKHFSGLHFHTHCEQDSAALNRTLPHVIEHFGEYLGLCRWVNFGGGHHITRDDYDCALLVNLIRDFRVRYEGVIVMLEPGEAVGWQCGDLIGEVVDIIEHDGQVAILDVSASCHMPDCLEMPYRPACYKITQDSQGVRIEQDLGEGVGKYCYRFGGPTCLAGDVIGDYSFDSPLQVGDRIAFVDMIHYTIVKNTTFNGVELPNLGMIDDNTFTLLKQFDYTHFKERN